MPVLRAAQSAPDVPFRPRDDAARAAAEILATQTITNAPRGVVVVPPNGDLPINGGERNMCFFAYGLHYLGIRTHVLVDPSPLARQLRRDGVPVVRPPDIALTETHLDAFAASANSLTLLMEYADERLRNGVLQDESASIKARINDTVEALTCLTIATDEPIVTLDYVPRTPMGWAQRSLQIKRVMDMTESTLCLTDSRRDSAPATLSLLSSPEQHAVWYTQTTKQVPLDALISTFARILTCGHGVRTTRFPDVPSAIAIPNGVDTLRFAPNRAPHARPADLPRAEFLLGYAAYFTPRKNHGALVKACSEARVSLGDFQLVFFGETHYQYDSQAAAYYQQVEAEVSCSSLNDRVHFMGIKDDLERYLPHLDVFVMPSTEEGLSLALLEAMSCGVAVLASDIPGNLELAGQGVQLFNPHDPQDLACRLTELAHNPEQRRVMGSAAAAHIRNGGYTTAGMLSNMAKALTIE